jgi:CheY-like chemotaxis protein
MSTTPDEEPGYCNVHIAISDTGIGIAPGKLKSIFEKFTQADSSTTRKYGGTGLGLAISKNLAEIMGGSITIKSDPGKGAEFTLNLPLELADESAAHKVIAEVDQKQPPDLPVEHGCILLVEDYKPNVLVAALMLESLGYSYDVVSSGLEALETIRVNRGKYMAVLMDVQMSGIDGYETTKIIREEEKAKDLPRLTIIAMTAHALQGDRERCVEAGMDDYISKPFQQQQLKDKLARQKS